MNATAIIVAFAAVLGTGAAGVGTWLVARRQTSGQIGTSDAAVLWRASEEMRTELRAEVVALRVQAVALLEKIDRLEQRLKEYEPHG